MARLPDKTRCFVAAGHAEPSSRPNLTGNPVLPLECFSSARLSFAALFFPMSDTSMRKILILAVSAAALMVSACNTIAGVGQDVSAAGRAVTNTAKDAK